MCTIELLLCDFSWSGKMDNLTWFWNQGCQKIGVPVSILGQTYQKDLFLNFF